MDQRQRINCCFPIQYFKHCGVLFEAAIQGCPFNHCNYWEGVFDCSWASVLSRACSIGKVWICVALAKCGFIKHPLAIWYLFLFRIVNGGYDVQKFQKLSFLDPEMFLFEYLETSFWGMDDFFV